MKKLLLVLIIGTLFSIGAVSAQGGFGQRVTMEERVKRITSKLDSAFKLDTQRLSAVDTALKVLFKAQDAKRQEMMSGGGMPDRELMMAEMKKVNDAQAEQFKAILTPEQFEKYKTMQSQQRQGGPPRN